MLHFTSYTTGCLKVIAPCVWLKIAKINMELEQQIQKDQHLEVGLTRSWHDLGILNGSQVATCHCTKCLTLTEYKTIYYGNVQFCGYRVTQPSH